MDYAPALHPARGRAERAARPRPARMPGWGWLEWVILGQVAIPALLFVPGLTKVRVVTRVAAYVMALMAWAAVFLSGRRAPGRVFPAAPWLAVAAAWLLVSILHPTTNTPLAGAAQATLVIAIFSPAFWGGGALAVPRQLRRLMALLFLCNVASALVGIGQYYRPDIFNPPVIPMLEMNKGRGYEESLSFTTSDGRKVLRPCGLTDTPGGASTAGATACLVGLCWALRPMAGWKRLASLLLALLGAAILFLSQVRGILAAVVGSIAVMVGLFALRRDYRRATLLGVSGAGAFGVAMIWIVTFVGSGALDRFRTLLETPPAELYYRNRGHFLQATLDVLIWEYPLGAGLGRWGMIHAYFGDPGAGPERGMLWSELQWTAWVYDGGIPLLAISTAALAVAIFNAVRIIRTSRDEEIGCWAVAICALNLNALALCFAAIPFIGPYGIQFWALNAALHAADQRARLAAARGARA
jgi:hypothetical protein